ncbi:MAG TPA: hypothetical protein VJZ24_02230 [Thermodesulfovibrionales bacterium]|nr:hypothetical protein [Thermodesulfovibrionales bacterium]
MVPELCIDYTQVFYAKRCVNCGRYVFKIKKEKVTMKRKNTIKGGSKMAKKKNDKKSKGKVAKVIAMLLLTLCFAIPSFAADGDIVQYSGVNLSGDTLYLPSSGSFAVGIGTDIATFYDVVKVRGEYVDPMKDGEDHKAGVGVGIDAVKIIDKLGGIWFLGGVNVSTGIMGLTNLDGDVHLEPAIFLSIVQVFK